MKFGDLFKNISYTQLILPKDEVEIKGINIDSRLVKPGDMFVAMKGTQSDGHNFITAAEEKGAVLKEINNLKEESKKYDEIKKAIEENKEFIESKDDILKELSELRKAENERKIKEYEAKYNFNYNENAQDKEIIDKLLTGDVDMELMEKLAERIKIEAASDGSAPGGRNPENSGETGETGSTGGGEDENAPSFTTREEYNKILKDMGFNRTRI